MILRKLDEINKYGLPVVISGDFNTMSDNFVFDPFIGRFDNAREVAAQTDNEATYTNWDGTGNKIIDHIFCCGFDVKRYRTVNERTYIGKGNLVIFDTDVPCPYLSDHDPITAILEL
jgi:endonuclease/exonuclease/phosphatase family metal-dependent hydrolase